MASEAMLTAVKQALGVTGTYLDNTISVYIDDVVDYMTGAGVSAALIASSTGVISRGVSDLWDNDGGNVQFSPAFHERVSQLALRSK